MLGDYENLENLDTLTDEELAAIARERLAEFSDLDIGRVEVGARDGRLLVRGRVGTEGDRQRVEQVLTDVLGATRVASALMVDKLDRERTPTAADSAAAQRAQAGAQPGGATRTTDEAAHLRPNVAAEQFGTRDTHEAIERGYSYEPPDGPVPEGTESREGD